MERLLVKIGGGRALNWDWICDDLYALLREQEVIVVHGASVLRNEIAQKLGSPSRVVESPSGISSVYTDASALDVFLMAYAGLANKRIVAMLQSRGIQAVGLSGVDGRLWEGKRKPDLLFKENGKTKLLSDNFTGRIEKVNTHLIELLLQNHYVPVLCPPGLSYENEIINVDNDRAVAVLAGAMRIRRVVVLFEAPGLLRDPADETSRVARIEREKIPEYTEYAGGRMAKKLMGAREALKVGVEKIYWGDGRIPHPILSALSGQGTTLG